MRWHTRYEQDDDGPGIAVEMNYPGEIDDYVTVDEGGLGRVELVGADPQSENTYEIKLETGPEPGAIRFSSDPAQPHSDVPGESEPPWDPGSGDVMELGDDGDGQWYDYRLVRAFPGSDGSGGYTLGHTEFRAWMIESNVSGFDDEDAVKHSDDIIVCDVKIVAFTASDASLPKAEQPDPANVPVNASVPQSMGGTGEEAELRAKIWVKGPANTYPFVIVGEDKLQAWDNREVELTGAGTNLTGYSYHFTLHAAEQSTTGDDAGLVVAEWPTGSGVSGAWATRDDSIVCYPAPEYSITLRAEPDVVCPDDDIEYIATLTKWDGSSAPDGTIVKFEHTPNPFLPMTEETIDGEATEDTTPPHDEPGNYTVRARSDGYHPDPATIQVYVLDDGCDVVFGEVSRIITKASWITFNNTELPLVVSRESLIDWLVNKVVEEGEEAARDAAEEWLSKLDDLAAEIFETVDDVSKLVGKISAVLGKMGSVALLDKDLLVIGTRVGVKAEIPYRVYHYCELQEEGMAEVEVVAAFESVGGADNLALVSEINQLEQLMSLHIDQALSQLDTMVQNKKQDIEDTQCSNQ